MWTVWTLSMLIYLWLTGSLVLPFMVVACWGAASWGRLRWLTRRRKRWILLCGSYGVVMVLALAVSEWLENSTFGGLDFLGWAGAAVWSALPGFLLRMAPPSITYWLVVSLSALLEGLIYCGFAAVAWGTLARLKHEAFTHAGRGTTKRYCAALLLSACLWGIANDVHSWRRVTCWDCFWPHGIPFTFYHEGGFAGGDGFVWQGVVGDALVILLCGIILGWAWNWFSLKYSIVKGG